MWHWHLIRALLPQEPGEAPFAAEGSEASFVTAASQAVPAGSVVSDLDYASLDDEADDEVQHEALYNQVRLDTRKFMLLGAITGTPVPNRHLDLASTVVMHVLSCHTKVTEHTCWHLPAAVFLPLTTGSCT